MPTPTSRLAYSSDYDLMDQALEAERGIRIQFTDYGAANHFRMRLNSARKIDRETNAQNFEPGHPMYGRSLYDPLVFRIENDGAFWVRLERWAQGLIIEEIKDERSDEGDLRPTPRISGEEAEGDGEATPPATAEARRF